MHFEDLFILQSIDQYLATISAVEDWCETEATVFDLKQKISNKNWIQEK